jgi:transcriptional regulator with XRE-family HTH domain
VTSRDWDGNRMRSAQIRAARGLLGWTQDRLAAAAGLPIESIMRMEEPEGAQRSPPQELEAAAHALRMAGVEFINGGSPGVRLKPKASFVVPDELSSETDL